MRERKTERLTELVFILDRSGSMGGLESDTIGGFNRMLERQKKEPGRAYVTTVLFDDRYELLHDHLSIRGVRPMTGRQYYVRGCTALLDAVGKTIRKIVNIQRNAGEAERADQVIFVITTDGLENASREYSCDRVKEMIEYEKEKYGWEFLFLGANMDAVKEAGRLGIQAERAASFVNDREGVQLNYEVISRTVSSMRMGMAPAGGAWKAPIERRKREREKRRNPGGEEIHAFSDCTQ